MPSSTQRSRAAWDIVLRTPLGDAVLIETVRADCGYRRPRMAGLRWQRQGNRRCWFVLMLGRILLWLSVPTIVSGMSHLQGSLHTRKRTTQWPGTSAEYSG